MAWHMTPLMDHGMVVDVLKPIRFFRDLGIPVRSAMNTDVNGLPWGVVDALLDHGITGMSHGDQRAFRPCAPPMAARLPLAGAGRADASPPITASSTASPATATCASRSTWTKRGERVPAMGEALGRARLSASLPDDADHQHPLPRQRLAAGGAARLRPPLQRRPIPEIRLRFGTLSEFFDRLRAEPEDRLPLMRGDWTDWWNFGAGSTAHETARRCRASATSTTRSGSKPGTRARASRAAGRRCATTARDGACPLRRAHLGRRPLDQPALLARDAHPATPEARLAAEGASLARMLRRDGLERLAIDAGGEEPRLLVYNPHPFPVRRSRCACPTCRRWPARPIRSAASASKTWCPPGRTSHRIQRQDVILSDLSDDRAYWTAPIEVPALSYVTMPAAGRAAGHRRARAPKGGMLSNGRLAVDARREGRRLALAQARRRRICRRRADGPALRRAGPRAVEPATRDGDLRPHRGRIARLAQVLAHRLERGARHAGRPSRSIAPSSPAAAPRSPNPSRCRTAIASRSSTASSPTTPRWRSRSVVDKVPLAEPHAPLPAACRRRSANPWHCDFETGGAMVRLDDEQLPYASRALHHHPALDPASPTTGTS